jgi:dienelactone hydrolase
MPNVVGSAMVVGAIVAAASWAAQAAVKTEAVDYKDADVALEGMLAYDDAVQGPRPLVLVVHEWWGLNDYAKGRARQLAELGYVAFAVDMYGKGVLATDPKQAGELAGKLKGDRKAMRQRIAAALGAVKSNARVDPKRIAAIGYCFGGTAVLELARSGVDIAAVVSFHGGLDTPTDTKGCHAKVLVCTGADDRAVPMTQVTAFIAEMRADKVDFEVIIYGGAVHAFTNPASGDDPSKNVAYNAPADRRSWQAMKDFLAEAFAPTPAPAK